MIQEDTMTTITSDTIREAAEGLVQAGHEPTLRRLREALGGGSYATLTPLLAAWRAQREERQALAEVDVPEEVSRLLDEVGARVWSAARDLAEVGRASLQRDLSEAMAAAEARAAEQVDALAEVESRADEAEGRASVAERRAADAEAEVAQVRQEAQVAAGAAAAALAVLREQVAAAEARADREAEARRAAELEAARLGERIAVREAQEKGKEGL